MNDNEENRQKHFRSHRRRRRRRHRRRRCRCCSRRRRRRFTSTASSFSTSSSSSSSVHHLFTADVFQPHSSSFGFCCSSPPTIEKTTDRRQQVKQKSGESLNSKKKLQLKQVSQRNKFLDFLFVRRLQFFPAQTDLWSRGSSLSATLMSSLTPDPGPTPPSACPVIVAAGATSYGT